jgi:hypothetical protein
MVIVSHTDKRKQDYKIETIEYHSKMALFTEEDFSRN